MGKRSDFDRIDRDLYRTFDPRAGKAIAPHLESETRFVEPCAGQGDLILQLQALGHICVAACDIEPLAPGIQRGDALKLVRLPRPAELFITNPPWKRPLLHAIIRHLTKLGPLWALFDADWAFTEQAEPFLDMCVKIVSAGRLLWIPGTTQDGKDNCAWYLFDRAHSGGPRFYGGRP